VSSYVVDDGTASPPTTVAASGVTATTYTVSGLAASTTYYFSVAVVDADGTSGASTPVSDTTSPTTNQAEIVAIDSGASAPVSNANGGDSSFVADEFYNGGGTSTSTSPVNVAGVTNAAPMNVYLTQRNGAFNYTIPGLAPGAQYTVLLHLPRRISPQQGSASSTWRSMEHRF